MSEVSDNLPITEVKKEIVESGKVRALSDRLNTLVTPEGEKIKDDLLRRKKIGETHPKMGLLISAFISLCEIQAADKDFFKDKKRQILTLKAFRHFAEGVVKQITEGKKESFDDYKDFWQNLHRRIGLQRKQLETGDVNLFSNLLGSIFMVFDNEALVFLGKSLSDQLDYPDFIVRRIKESLPSCQNSASYKELVKVLNFLKTI